MRCGSRGTCTGRRCGKDGHARDGRRGGSGKNGRWRTALPRDRGEATAKGICGSGIVDLLAELFLHGWIDIRGILQPEKSRWIVEKDGMLAVNYAPELYFYQSDIEEFIRTKAAKAYTMVAIMPRESGIELSELEAILCGGRFLENTCPKNPRSLSACIRTWNGIGSSMRAILPLEGAVCALLDRGVAKRSGGDPGENGVYPVRAVVEDFLNTMVASTGTSPYRSGAVSYGEGETGTAPRRRESSGCSETEIRNLVTIQ